MVYLDQSSHTYACQHCLITGTRNIIYDVREFAENQSGRSWSVSENAHNS